MSECRSRFCGWKGELLNRVREGTREVYGGNSDSEISREINCNSKLCRDRKGFVLLIVVRRPKKRVNEVLFEWGPK